MKFLKSIREYRKVSNVDEVARRYFVMNGFDGILTVLGIVMGAYAANVKNPEIIIVTVFSVCIANAISGFSGTFMSESAERIRQVKVLERKMLKTFHNSIIDESARFAAYYCAIVAAFSPFSLGLLNLTPMVLAYFSLVSYMIAFYLLIAISLSTLFILGIFLGRVSRENILFWGIKMFLVGLITTAGLFFLGMIFNI